MALTKRLWQDLGIHERRINGGIKKMKKILIEDDEEMEYLSMALKPMKRKTQKILTITKCRHEGAEYIKIRYVDFDGLIDEWCSPSYIGGIGRRIRGWNWTETIPLRS